MFSHTPQEHDCKNTVRIFTSDICLDISLLFQHITDTVVSLINQYTNFWKAEKKKVVQCGKYDATTEWQIKFIFLK